MLWVFDTQTIVERVAARELELGVVGAGRRHRGVVFEPFLHDEVILACPPGHPFAGRTVTLDELRGRALIVMQEGAGVRQMIEDELRRAGMRLRDLDVRLELGLQESVTSAVAAGYGVTFISRTSVESDLAAGTLAEARVEGLELEREIFLVRASGRAETRATRAFVEFAARDATARDRPLVARRAARRARRARDRAAAARRERALARARPSGRRRAGRRSRHDRIEVPAAADALLAVGGGSAIDTAKAPRRCRGLPLVSVPTTYSGAEWTPTLRRARARPAHRRRRRRRAARGDRLRGRPHARPAAGRDRRHGAERARALRRGAVRARAATTPATRARSPVPS